MALPGFLKTLFDHNRYFAMAIVVSVVIVVNLFGCQPTTMSPYSKTRVTAAQLDAEIQAYQVSADSRVRAIMAEVDEKKTMSKAAYADLEHKRTVIQSGLDAIAGMVGSIPGPAGEAIGGVLAAITVGLLGDNARKNGKIEQYKSQGQLVALPASYAGDVNPLDGSTNTTAHAASAAVILPTTVPAPLTPNAATTTAYGDPTRPHEHLRPAEQMVPLAEAQRALQAAQAIAAQQHAPPLDPAYTQATARATGGGGGRIVETD